MTDFFERWVNESPENRRLFLAELRKTARRELGENCPCCGARLKATKKQLVANRENGKKGGRPPKVKKD